MKRCFEQGSSRSDVVLDLVLIFIGVSRSSCYGATSFQHSPARHVLSESIRPAQPPRAITPLSACVGVRVRAHLSYTGSIWACAEHAIAFVGDVQVASLALCGHVAERSFDGGLALGFALGSHPDLLRRLLLDNCPINIAHDLYAERAEASRKPSNTTFRNQCAGAHVPHHGQSHCGLAPLTHQ